MKYVIASIFLCGLAGFSMRFSEIRNLETVGLSVELNESWEDNSSHSTNEDGKAFGWASLISASYDPGASIFRNDMIWIQRHGYFDASKLNSWTNGDEQLRLIHRSPEYVQIGTSAYRVILTGIERDYDLDDDKYTQILQSISLSETR